MANRADLRLTDNLRDFYFLKKPVVLGVGCNTHMYLSEQTIKPIFTDFVAGDFFYGHTPINIPLCLVP